MDRPISLEKGRDNSANEREKNLPPKAGGRVPEQKRGPRGILTKRSAIDHNVVKKTTRGEKPKRKVKRPRKIHRWNDLKKSLLKKTGNDGGKRYNK